MDLEREISSMDPDPPRILEEQRGGGEQAREGRPLKILLRCGCSIILLLGLPLFLAFVVGLIAIALGNLSATPPVSVPALCRILSSSVDIKSSKICELGLLNYKAKHVLYPLSKGEKRFRCHDDYYWASVFEVEYKERFSGHVYQAIAEAPKEALPRDCRPSFGIAWVTKTKFKVNETYNCRYTLGTHKADIYPDKLFNCQTKDPSAAELGRRFLILLMKSSIFDEERTSIKGAHAVAGTVCGMLFGMCSMILLKTLKFSVLSLFRCFEAQRHCVRVFAIRFRRVCFLVAYVCAAGWLMLEYGDMIGLNRISFGD